MEKKNKTLADLLRCVVDYYKDEQDTERERKQEAIKTAQKEALEDYRASELDENH